MSLLLSKIAEGRIHLVDLMQWRRDYHPEVSYDKFYKSLEQLIEQGKIKEHHDPDRGSEFEATDGTRTKHYD